MTTDIDIGNKNIETDDQMDVFKNSEEQVYGYNKQINDIMDDIDESKYEDDGDDKMNYASGDLMESPEEGTSIEDDDSHKRLERETAGGGVERLEPTFGGKSHEFVKKRTTIHSKDIRK